MDPSDDYIESLQTNLIVNYLPQSLTDEEFRSMFLSIGPVTSTKIVRDKNSGYSYGFGFVDYNIHADAKRAIETLNGLQLQHKTIKVAFSRQGDENRGGNLYITNIARTVTTQQLRSMFSAYGELIQCRIVSDKHTGLSKGIGFVLFMRKQDADVAIQHLNGHAPDGCTEKLNIKFAMDNREKAKGMINKLTMPTPSYPNETSHLNFYGNEEYDGYEEYSYVNSGHPQGRMQPHMRQGSWPTGPPPSYTGGPMRRNDNTSAGGRRRFNPMAQQLGQPMGQQYPPAEEQGHILFVYNIGTNATESTLYTLFAPFGAILKVNIIMSPETDQCKGYGFVTMANYTDAANAIKSLDGYAYGAKSLQVSFKKSK